MDKWVSVQIPIPRSRVPEFFEMFGRWIHESGPTREERLDQSPELPLSSWQDGPEDQRHLDAQHVYARFLYFNPSDPALFVRPYGFNFGNKWAWVFIACIIAYPFLAFWPA